MNFFKKNRLESLESKQKSIENSFVHLLQAVEIVSKSQCVEAKNIATVCKAISDLQDSIESIARTLKYLAKEIDVLKSDLHTPDLMQ